MEQKTEETKTIRIDFADYNTMTLIAKQNGFLDPKTGKMSARLVVSYLIKNFAEKIA